MMADTLASLGTQLDRLRVALGRVQRDAVKAVQKQAKDAKADIFNAFIFEKYFGRRGNTIAIRAYGAAWRKRKERLKLNLRRGWATGGIGSVLANDKGIAKTEKGFVIDLIAAAQGVMTKYPTLKLKDRKKVDSRGRKINLSRFRESDPFVRKQKRSSAVAVQSYLPYFAAAKAPSLGSISKARQDAIKAAVQAAIDDRIRKVSRSISKAAAKRGGYVLRAEFDLFVGGRLA